MEKEHCLLHDFLNHKVMIAVLIPLNCRLYRRVHHYCSGAKTESCAKYYHRESSAIFYSLFISPILAYYFIFEIDVTHH